MSDTLSPTHEFLPPDSDDEDPSEDLGTESPETPRVGPSHQVEGQADVREEPAEEEAPIPPAADIEGDAGRDDLPPIAPAAVPAEDAIVPEQPIPENGLFDFQFEDSEPEEEEWQQMHNDEPPVPIDIGFVGDLPAVVDAWEEPVEIDLTDSDSEAADSDTGSDMSFQLIPVAPLTPYHSLVESRHRVEMELLQTREERDAARDLVTQREETIIYLVGRHRLTSDMLFTMFMEMRVAIQEGVFHNMEAMHDHILAVVDAAELHVLNHLPGPFFRE